MLDVMTKMYITIIVMLDKIQNFVANNIFIGDSLEV